MTPQNPVPATEISTLILAGGRGSRLGGSDKGLMPIGGKPALEHLLERVRPQGGPILISANRNLEAYRRYGHLVIEDDIGEFAGPLAGFAAALSAIRTEFLLTVPVDAPLLSGVYRERMIQGVQSTPAQICVAEFNGRVEPVFCMLHRSFERHIRDYLEAGNHSVQRWLETVGAGHVDCSDLADQFINVNDAGDLRRAEQRLQGQE